MLVFIDYEGSGQEENASVDEISNHIKYGLENNGWQDRAEVIVFEPELEIWLWVESTHTANALGWDDYNTLKDWLINKGLWKEDEPKPMKPKEALEMSLTVKGIRRSSSIYEKIASKVSLHRCRVPSFLKFREILQKWFPKNKVSMSSKPTALLIGDSICMGYRPLVKQRLEDKVNVIGIDDNGGDSSNLLKNLDEWIINRNADLIHFNCGLHDLRVDPKTGNYQQPLDIYKTNLQKIVQRLKEKTNAKLVWATSTPVIDERHNAVKEFHRYERDVEAYNKAATAIMKEAGIVIDDLFSIIMTSVARRNVSDDIEICLMPDGVHATEHGNNLLTNAVINCILRKLRLK